MNYRSLSTPKLIERGGAPRVAEAQYRLQNWQMKPGTVARLTLFVEGSKAPITKTTVVTTKGKGAKVFTGQERDFHTGEPIGPAPKKAKSAKKATPKATATTRIPAVKPQDRPYGTKTGDEIVALLAAGDPDAIAEAVDYRSTPTVKAALKAVLAGEPIPEKPAKAPTIRNAKGTVVDPNEAALKVKANLAYGAIMADAPYGFAKVNAKAAYKAVMEGATVSDAITDGLRSAVEAFEAKAAEAATV